MSEKHVMGDTWQEINSAPKDGTHIWGLRGLLAQHTWWGKVSHINLHGWCYLAEPGDAESCAWWDPTHWQPLTVDEEQK